MEQTRGVTSRLKSGHPQLDLVLGGGLASGALTLITGAPGTGKTLLAQQFVFSNASPTAPALYVSTVSEPRDKILRYGRSLSFFDESLVGTAVFYEDLGGLLDERGLPAFVDRLQALIGEHSPAMIVVDSFKALHAFAREASDFRWFLHDFAARLSAAGASSFWVGEYGLDDIAKEPEFAVADAIIQLSSTMVKERENRVLQVLKLRGSGFLSGQHAYRLSERGVDVFPRLADIGDPAGYELSDERVSSGIPVLDTMLGDGYWPGACTLVAGPSGSGKTVMALSFIFGGAANGERGLIANLQENPSQLQRTARGFGWSLEDPNVSVLYRSTVDLYIDEWVYNVLDAVESQNVSRLVIDSLGDLSFASPDQIRFREYIYSLAQRCSRRGISVLMTMEVPDLFHLSRLSESGISNMSDNVVLLQFLRSRSRVKRALTVLKTRASLHEPEIREYVITSDGFVLGQPFEADVDTTTI
ncbi:MAG: circadian clock protein KaiC [Actinomycetota bacterium]|nr:circadian clock protein KaiC [Actinomycetota bacterium]